MSDKEIINVLIVDDEREFLAATAKALGRRGFTVRIAESVAGAMTLLKDTQFHVAVLDVRLPDGDGHDLFLEIKRHYPELQGIILTGNRDENRSFRLSHQGLFDYLDKPCDIDLLARSILEAFRHGQEQGHEDIVSAETAAGGIRVLLIDDEEAFLSSMARLLKRRGMTVYQAKDGAEGLQIIEKTEVDVAIIDLKMPGMSGMEVLKRIKKRKPDVEAIILTGHATVESGVEGMKQGAADYLFKPQDPEALIRKIEFAAGRRSQESTRKRKWWPWKMGGRGE
jgi:DNA-binding NtrC family response regulator